MRDTHVSVLVIFDIPPGVDMDSLEPTLASFYSATRAGTRQCLYYGFARCGSQLLCRLLTNLHLASYFHILSCNIVVSCKMYTIMQGGLHRS